MSDAFKSIKQGLNEAIQYAKGNEQGTKLHTRERINVKEIRTTIGMTQVEFSAAIGINVSTLRHWEKGDQNPMGPALVLLNILKKQPRLFLKTQSL